MKKFSIGYNVDQPKNIQKAVLEFKDYISDIYCSWPNISSGRRKINQKFKQQLIADLQKYSLMGIKFNILYNSTYYLDIHKKEFFKEFDKIIEEVVDANIALDSITCVSPIIARYVKRTYNNFKVIASVNTQWFNIQQFQQMADVFDAFYIARQHNRNLNAIKLFRKWANDNNKELYTLANSGCIQYCANSINHQLEILSFDLDDEMNDKISENDKDNKYTFIDDPLLCAMCNCKNPQLFLARSTFIQPQYISLYYQYFDKIKIASRTSVNSYETIKAYITQSYKGNLQYILQPPHGYLYNATPLLNQYIDKTWYPSTLNCNGKCYNCKKCINTIQNAINKYNLNKVKK